MELILALALLALVAGLTIPLSWSMVSRNDLDVATGTLAASLRRAQGLAQAAANNQSWGIHAESSNVILFAGDNFAARDQAADEVYALPPGVLVSGQAENIFDKFSGEPKTPGVITLTGSDGQIRTVAVNTLGMVSD